MILPAVENDSSCTTRKMVKLRMDANFRLWKSLDQNISMFITWLTVIFHWIVHETHTGASCHICFVSSQLIAYTSIVNATASILELRKPNQANRCVMQCNVQSESNTDSEQIVFQNDLYWIPIDLLCLFIYLIRFLCRRLLFMTIEIKYEEEKLGQCCAKFTTISELAFVCVLVFRNLDK